jgi:hypothetical protein
MMTPNMKDAYTENINQQQQQCAEQHRTQDQQLVAPALQPPPVFLAAEGS